MVLTKTEPKERIPIEMNSGFLKMSLYRIVCVTVCSRMYFERKRFPIISKKTEMSSYKIEELEAYRVCQRESLVDIRDTYDISQGCASDTEASYCCKSEACVCEVLFFKHC